ncbi:MAG: mannitol dehydrogenase family protein [Pseudobacter sp.]|uniref:mannitol dehydrogenase family protein n=1 Tax=Pseudobacter sp. TaxID=2045420 RepID=UPI003F7E4DAE
MFLNKETVTTLPAAVITGKGRNRGAGSIVHFGVGGFHRSHQAWAIQQLIGLDPALNSTWNICGVCIMPQDKIFVEKMKKQDLLYSLRICASGEKEEVMVIDAITELLFGPEETEKVISRIADANTSLVTFTITEGGYNIDEATGEFDLKHVDIQHDLQSGNLPKTVFGYLAAGLKQRYVNGGAPLTLLSCDNIQGNGDVLKLALYSFVRAYHPALIEYLDKQVAFPNSMVDRITPVTQPADRASLLEKYGYEDECLVVCEPFFQWVIEKHTAPGFPPLEQAGVDLVSDVRAYESMKLRILNGGHSLTGLIGKAMGYNYIHDAITDKNISTLFDLYNEKEVHLSLEALPGVDYKVYANQVKHRFGNAMINDSTDRIISGSTAKIPKFVLPVINWQIANGIRPVTGALIVAAWWFYLDTQVINGGMINDPAAEEWSSLFKTHADNTLAAFLDRQDVFGDLSLSEPFRDQVADFAVSIRKHDMLYACAQAIKSLV